MSDNPTTSLLTTALLKAVQGARVDSVYVLGRLHRVDFHAPYPMCTYTGTASDVFAGAIARASPGVFEGVKVHPMSAAVYRVEAMEVPAPPAKVWVVLQSNYDESDIIAVFANEKAAESHAQRRRRSNYLARLPAKWHGVNVEEHPVIAAEALQDEPDGVDLHAFVPAESIKSRYPAAAAELYWLMVRLSEEVAFASWLDTLSDDLMRVVRGETLAMNDGGVSEEDAARLRELHRTAGGWWVWREGDRHPTFDASSTPSP